MDMDEILEECEPIEIDPSDEEDGKSETDEEKESNDEEMSVADEEEQAKRDEEKLSKIVDEETGESKKKKKSKKKSKKKKKAEKKEGNVYLPNKPLDEGEVLVCDESAYVIFRQAQTGAPCLSFDIIRDDLGDNRTDFPLSCYLVAGTQAIKPKENGIIVMKTSNLHKTQRNEDDDEDEEEDEDEKKEPRMDYASIAHFGCVNRIRVSPYKNTVLAASWSEMGRVNIWDLQKQIEAVNDVNLLSQYRKKDEENNTRPLFTFTGHQSEGFAVDWCPCTSGVLATGDCRKNIHIWHPDESSWNVDQRPLIGHTASVEDLQWSPNEPNVLCSASVDKSIRIWDARLSGNKACMITVENAHDSDVNVIHWNRNDPVVASGGDDGVVRIWDLRSLETNKAVATFKHHTKPITTIEWHPTENSVFASGGEDNQIALWDAAVERDDDPGEEDVEDIPAQLLFIHQGQEDIKELHWHPQIPGLIISTALSGFNIFKTISV